MPNKTIYVSDDDMPLFKRAQELGGGNLSQAISAALRRFVEIEEGRLEGFEEITVAVGSGVKRKQRFSGVKLGEWGRTTKSGKVEIFSVYRSRTGKFVLHVDRSDVWTSSGGWRGALGLAESNWGFIKGDSTLDIADSLEDLKDRIPAELYEVVIGLADEPAVEDLDI